MPHVIHHIDPVVFHICGPLAVRWYGLAYLLGFAASFIMLRHWSRQGGFEVPERETGHFILLLAFFGIFLGGRLGYFLLYRFEAFLHDPLALFRVWEGGMASHGGFVGALLFVAWYARRHGHSFWNLADQLVATVSLGIGFGRLANFVNGELWGRATDVRWAVVFPQELGLRFGDYDRAMIERLIDAGRLAGRHPSQLYQAAAEGFLVFGVVLWLRSTTWGKRPGALSAAYLVLYAAARIAVEFFREPDSVVYFGWLTKGQTYSLFMVLLALWIAVRKRLFEAP